MKTLQGREQGGKMIKLRETLNQLTQRHEAFMKHPASTASQAYIESGKQFLQEIRAQGRYLDDPILRDEFSQLARDVNQRLFELTYEYFPARLEFFEEETSNELVINNVSDELVMNHIYADIVTINHQVAPPRIPLQRPPRVAHFINREAELAQLLNDLQPGRVVTIVGPGGVGKSALAAKAVWQLAPSMEPPEQFPDGIIFHSFYNHPQVERALENIARAFGEELQPTPYHAAQRALIGRQALLVLDGTENADDLQTVLAIRGSCGVLVTSRRRRHTDAVGNWQNISPLPLDEAMQLLQAWGTTMVTDRDAARQICELVGGLPLAVRLIGHYMYSSQETATEYLAWLKETPMEALEQGRHRQESIPLLLERSLNQVSQRAQQILAMTGMLALAPFSWEVIAAGLDMSARQVRHFLGELVNSGLLFRPSQRYEVSHALIHTYAGERLIVPNELIARLVSYYTKLAIEQSQQGSKGYAILDSERPHLLRLLRACVERQDWEAVKSLVWAIDYYLDMQGHWTERITFLEAGLVAVRGLGKQSDEGAFLGKLGNTYHALGQVDQAQACYNEALVIQQEIRDLLGEGDTLDNLGNISRELGDIKQAIAYYHQALEIKRAIGNHLGESNTLSNLGNASVALGLVAQAIYYYQQALAIQRQIGDRRGEGSVLGNFGGIYLNLGNVPQAIKSYEQALAINREVGNLRGEAAELINLGVAYRHLEQLDKAIDFYEQALTIHESLGDQLGEAISLHNLAELYQIQGHNSAARSFCKRALGTFEVIKSPYAELSRDLLTLIESS
jgi:tetratricopeptide (TPR) repeat protein